MEQVTPPKKMKTGNQPVQVWRAYRILALKNCGMGGNFLTVYFSHYFICHRGTSKVITCHNYSKETHLQTFLGLLYP